MKKVLVALALLVAGQAGAAVFTGRLDLTLDPEAFGGRSFTANEYAYGFQKRAWHLDADGHEEFKISAVVGSSTVHGILGGLSIVIPGGGVDQILALANGIHDMPQTLALAAQYAAYLKTGVSVLYDPTQIKGARPAFLGYQIAVSVPFGGAP